MVPYDALFDHSAPLHRVSDRAIAEFLRCSMGLSAWKQYRDSRWALRVNPSSGNLHPTEAYVVRGGRVSHYAPREHALEQRTVLEPAAWAAFAPEPDGFLVALTSIHWREAWKYGERAFRYCQHDTGHAIAALRFAAAMLGWRLRLLPQWSDAGVATLLGIDRLDDFPDAEREEPECVAVVTPGPIAPWLEAEPSVLVDAARRAAWTGVANRLSPSRIEWPIIDQVAEATVYPGAGTRDPGLGIRDSGLDVGDPGLEVGDSRPGIRDSRSAGNRATASEPGAHGDESSSLDARRIILQRRSALGFDARSSLPRDRFFSMLAKLQPPAPPWDAIGWPPQIHLLIFVHRVDGLTPGLYAYLRDPQVVPEWRAAMRPEFLWEPVQFGARSNDPNAPNVPNDPNAPNAPNAPNDPNALFLLVPTDVTWIGNRLSCDQDIAGDGFFSLGMIARFESSLREHGPSFYRRLFWESGILGQVLYLEAEAAGARATGIGCFYDDAVHESAGLSGHEWQSLYHFSMGVPVDDGRLTTEPGYSWEAR